MLRSHSPSQIANSFTLFTAALLGMFQEGAAPGPRVLKDQSQQDSGIFISQNLRWDTHGVRTELSPFVRDLTVELAAYISTEEVMMGDSGEILHGTTAHSVPGSFFEADGLRMLRTGAMQEDKEEVYFKLMVLMSDDQQRLLASVCHVSGSQLTFGRMTEVAAPVTGHEGRSSVSLSIISDQHFAVSFSIAQSANELQHGTYVTLGQVHPVTDEVFFSPPSLLHPAESSDTCVLASPRSVIAAMVPASLPQHSLAFLLQLSVSQSSDGRPRGTGDRDLWPSYAIQPPHHAPVTWQAGGVMPGSLSCEPLNRSHDMGALLLFRLEKPAADCGAFPAPLHASIEPEGVVPGGEAVNITCNTGYAPHGNGTSTPACLHNGTFEEGIICVPISCGPYPRVQNGSVSPAGEIAFGEEVRVACDAGFELAGDGGSPPRCMATGNFSAAQTCVPRGQEDCGLYPPPRFGFVEPAGILPVWGRASFSCREGYRLFPFPRAPQSPQCLSTVGRREAGGFFATPADFSNYTRGTFVSDIVTGFDFAPFGECRPVSCGSFPAPHHGSVHPATPVEFAVGAASGVELRCDRGYVLSGSGRSAPRCLSNGLFEKGKSCVPGGASAVILSGALGSLALAGETRVAERGVEGVVAVGMWPWRERGAKGAVTDSTKCTRMEGYVRCVSSPADVGARGDCALQRSSIQSDEAPLEVGGAFTGGTCGSVGIRCLGACQGIPTEVQVEEVVLLALQGTATGREGGSGRRTGVYGAEIHIVLGGVAVACPAGRDLEIDEAWAWGDGSEPGDQTLHLALIPESEAVIAAGASDSVQLRITRTASHRNQVVVSYGTKEGEEVVRAVEVLVNASRLLEELDVRSVPSRHTGVHPLAVTVGLERRFAPHPIPALALHVIALPPLLSSCSIRERPGLVRRHASASSVRHRLDEAEAEGVLLYSNRSLDLELEREICRSNGTEPTPTDEEAAASQDTLERDCTGRRGVKEVVRGDIIERRELNIPTPRSPATSCGLGWYLPGQTCANFSSCLIDALSVRWWSTFQATAAEGNTDIHIWASYRAPVTRQVYEVELFLQALSTNTSCFVGGLATAAQYRGSQNQGEGYCMLRSIMASCEVQDYQLLLPEERPNTCPTFPLSECNVPPPMTKDQLEYHLVDYATIEEQGVTIDGSPIRFFPTPPPQI